MPAKFAPFRKTSSFSTYRNKDITAGIPSLLFSRGPTAVAGFVVAVLIGPTVNGVVFAGTLAHVGKEVVKRVSPTVANYNATSAIAVVSNVIGIVTPGTHSIPSVVRSSGSPVATMTMSCRPLSRNIFLNATARLSVSINEIAANNRYIVSAIASTQPSKPRSSACKLSPVTKRDDSELSELPPRQINSRHGTISMKKTHRKTNAATGDGIRLSGINLAAVSIL